MSDCFSLFLILALSALLLWNLIGLAQLLKARR